MKLQHKILGRLTVVINRKGYAMVKSGKYRDKYLHRAVFTEVAGRPPKEGFQIHHMNGKHCSCPEHMVEIQECLHPSNRHRHPYTGAFISQREYLKLMDQFR